MYIVHVFHIHQIHFLAVAIDGVPLAQPVFRDVLEIPTWSGRESDPYPNMTILVDFRSPLIVGLFPYHCHILSHEDHGMMATIQVLPGKLAVPKTTPAPTSIISLFVASSQSSPYTVSDPVVIGLICVSLFACVLLLIIFGLLYSSKRSNKKSFDSDVKASIDIEMDDENCNSTPDLVIQSEATNTPDPFPSALGSPIIDYSTYNEQNDQWSNEKP